MNVADMATSVKRVFGDEGGVQITDTDIIRWINKAQHKILLDNPGLLETTVTANSVVNQAEYTYPADLSVLNSIQYKGFHLKNLSLVDFNTYIDGYSAPNGPGSGIPQVYMVWNNIFRLFPAPSESVTNGIKLFYIKNPTEVTTLADELSVPIAYHNIVEDYCLRKAYELDESPELAAAAKASMDEELMRLNDRNKVAATEQYPTITRNPDPDDGWYLYGC